MRCGDIDCGKLTRAESRCDAWQQASLISLRRWGPLVPNTADIVGVTVRPALGRSLFVQNRTLSEPRRLASFYTQNCNSDQFGWP